MQTKAIEYSLKATKSDFDRAKIKSSKDAYNYIKQFYFDDIDIYESCFILLLNNSNDVIGYAKISQGGILSTVVDVRLICKYAVDSLATSVILAHNHPSGTLKPSNPDIQITKKTKEALSLFDCTLVDHIILTSNSYSSLADEGFM